MSVLRIRQRDTIKPLHVTLLCLLGVTVAGGSLLLSCPESTRLVDGAIAWHEQSLLRALVQVLCLNYEWPTKSPGAVKIYILGLGAGLAMTALGVALLVRGRAGEEESPADIPDDALPFDIPDDDVIPERTRHHVAPLLAAQLLVLLFLLWSFASSRWSAAPGLAVGGSLLLVIHFMWAFALGNGLNATAAKVATRIIVAVTAITALVAIWYFYGRNPVIRAKFPFGNPEFLSTCLIPGIMLSIAILFDRLGAADTTERGNAKKSALMILAGVTLATSVWAGYLADSRGAIVGLVVGLLVMVFLALRGRWRVVPVLLVIALVVGGWLYFDRQAHAFSPTGRSATIRLRTYAWDYAWRMFQERPLTGHGQGAYVLKGDSYAAHDVLNDPEVFHNRIAHAHNEWLETLADLGSVGLVLILGALCFTFVTGWTAMVATDDRTTRWCLIALMGALTALIVEECFGVGLRVSGVPTMYYSLIGLIWAFGSVGTGRHVARFATLGRGRVAAGAAAIVFGLTALVLTQQDWSAARHASMAEAALTDGRIEEAILSAERATTRLNPQRALVNMFRLARARLSAAIKLQQRAADREQRAFAVAPPNGKLAALASDDYMASEEHCVQAAHALKELVTRAPGFLNHGYLDYLINVTRAVNTEALVRLHAAVAEGSIDDATATQARLVRDQYLKNAIAALERELRRQPFDPPIAVAYASLTAEGKPLAELFEVLARPLRYNRIEPDYVRFLMSLSNRSGFDQELTAMIDEIVRTISNPAHADDGAAAKEQWSPERLRLAATVWFMRGDYGKARGALEVAVQAYEALPSHPQLAMASAWAELAQCRFFDNPNEPVPAIEAAERAIATAPPSEPGRTLVATLQSQLINYLLAAGEETQAEALLKQIEPPGTSGADLRARLGSRYRRLCETLLDRREGTVLRKPVDELFPKMLAWNRRALELNPTDPLNHRLAADLSFYAGDDADAAKHLEDAVENGLPLDAAMQFLSIARQQAPTSEPLQSLWTKWLEEFKGAGAPVRSQPPPPDLLAPQGPGEPSG